MKKVNLAGVLSSGYLTITWSLLIWLNFNISAHVIAHFIVLPVLLLITGASAIYINKASCHLKH